MTKFPSREPDTGKTKGSRDAGTIFGSDGAGTVHELGPDVPPDTTLAVGDEVIISPSRHWGSDERFPSGWL